MHKMRDGTFAIENIERGRWNALDRERRIKAVSHADHRICKNYEVWVEQEPGSGGKNQRSTPSATLPACAHMPTE